MDDLRPQYLDNDLQPLIDYDLPYLTQALGVIEESSRKIVDAYADDTIRYEVFLLLSARIYNHLLASQVLLRKGLLTDATISTRGAMESIDLFLFLMPREDLMERWLNGIQYSPREVREKLERSDSGFYKQLSQVVHPNFSAFSTYTSLPSLDLPALSVSFGPNFPPDATRSVFWGIVFTAWYFLHILEELFDINGRPEISRLCNQVRQDLARIMGKLSEPEKQDT